MFRGVAQISLDSKGRLAVPSRYREALLVRPVRGTGADERKLSELAGTMRALSGHYDQAARSAASL